MNIYKHHMNQDSSYTIKEYRNDGRVRTVGADNSGYLVFIVDNTPEIIEYVAPVQPSELDILNEEINNIKMQLMSADVNLQRSTEDIINTLINKGTTLVSDYPEIIITRKQEKETLRLTLINKISERDAL